MSEALISANDLHEAADDPLMNPSADPALDPAPTEAIGLEPDAVVRFLQSSNFAFPYPDGIRHNLDPESVAYGVCLGIVAMKRADSTLSPEDWMTILRLVVGGGLDEGGFGLWLSSGSPSRNDRIASGEIEAVIKDALSYLDSPAT